MNWLKYICLCLAEGYELLPIIWMFKLLPCYTRGLISSLRNISSFFALLLRAFFDLLSFLLSYLLCYINTVLPIRDRNSSKLLP